MDQFLVGWDATIWCSAGGDPVKVLDQVMEELVKCDDVIDPTIAHDGDGDAVTFEVIVYGEDALDAMQKASVLVRSCIHAAGAGTPGWPDAEDIKLLFEFSNPTIERIKDDELVDA